MVKDRPDWCVSRQRSWGVPITIFVSKVNGEPLINKNINMKILSTIKNEGIDAWFTKPKDYFLSEIANSEEYEKADECKNKLKALENYQSKSMVVSSKIKDLDIYSIISDENYSYINFTQISNGYIISSFNTHVKKSNVKEDKIILEQLISQIKVKILSKSKQILNWEPSTNIEDGIKSTIEWYSSFQDKIKDYTYIE